MDNRTSILISLSIGMAVGIAAIPALNKWAPGGPSGPGGTGSAGVTAVAPAGSTPAGAPVAASSADEVVEAFLGALARNDRELLESYLTTKARVGFGAENGFQLDGEGLEGFETGPPSVEGDAASVPVTMTISGEPQELSVRLRIEDSAWRIHGVGVSMGGSEFLIDFEGESNPLEAALESSLEDMGSALAEGMADAIGASFEAAMTEWSQGGSAEAIQGEHTSFDELGPVSMEELEESWSIDVVGGGRAVREVLAELLAESGLRIDDAEHGSQLDQKSHIDLTGVSRVAAIEMLCAEVQLIPEYPDSLASQDSLGFRAGKREHAVALVGPFVVEVMELVENSPHSTGELTLGARALGLSSAATAANTEMGNYIEIQGITGSDGSNLLADEDVQVWSTPTQANGVFSLQMSVDLHGLFGSVSSIASIEGEVSFQRPTEMMAFEFVPLEKGQLSADGWNVNCTEVGENPSFEIECEGIELEGRGVRFAPLAADGSPLGILSQSAWSNGHGLTASLNTPVVPTSLTVKVFATEELHVGFELVDVPLAEFADQPGQLAELEFDGDAPLVMQFKSFTDRSNPDFPRVELAIQNLTNKEAMRARATFEYLDGHDKVLEEFPHDLSGDFTFEGHAALSAPGAETTLESTAFFMPQETRSIRVRLESVEFVDGTTWESE